MSTKFVWLELSEKIWPLLKSRSMILSSMTQTIEKWGCHVLGRIDFWMVLRAHGTPWFHFIFCLEPTLGKDTWMRVFSATVMMIFLKVAFWKLLDHDCVQSYF